MSLMTRRRPNRPQSGFSLIEILVAVLANDSQLEGTSGDPLTFGSASNGSMVSVTVNAVTMPQQRFDAGRGSHRGRAQRPAHRRDPVGLEADGRLHHHSADADFVRQDGFSYFVKLTRPPPPRRPTRSPSRSPGAAGTLPPPPGEVEFSTSTWPTSRWSWLRRSSPTS
ncbi:MAG: prepilin-type N-terminal cleavage/methylation domain-containing protein [Gammaproteobacteria bacterium]|nr:prepilin-type N-terminal cleavage/methylation domain-containing protein [Gammaproteobacteria bacterium]